MRTLSPIVVPMVVPRRAGAGVRGEDPRDQVGSIWPTEEDSQWNVKRFHCCVDSQGPRIMPNGDIK